MANTVLIVDDSPSMRQLVSYTLSNAGFNVVSAVDGMDAIVKLEKEKYKMVITDLNMPRMDGMTLIKCLRTLNNHRFTPVVMLTTESKESKKEEGRAAGASGWIVKPFTPEQLISVVKKFVR